MELCTQHNIVFQMTCIQTCLCRVPEMSSSYGGRGASCWQQCQGWRGRLLTLNSRRRSYFVRYDALQLLHLWIFHCTAEWRVPNSLRLFESMVLRKILGPKREEGTGDWGKLWNEELCALYCSQKYYLDYKIKEDELGAAVATSNHCIGGCMGPRDSVDILKKEYDCLPSLWIVQPQE